MNSADVVIEQDTVLLLPMILFFDLLIAGFIHSTMTSGFLECSSRSLFYQSHNHDFQGLFVK